MRAKLENCLKAVDEVLLGKEVQVRLALTCLLARGHLLIEDLPGMGKTTLSHALARVLGLGFQRIQFTSDLLPGDVLGTSVFDKDSGQFVFHPGPIFSELVLADEINRATPKSQSALLEAMEEGQVTIEGATRPLPEPFFVIATQNPVTQGGTFALPESQLDRFLMRLSLGYPGRAAEKASCCWAKLAATCCRAWNRCSTTQELQALSRARCWRCAPAMRWWTTCCAWWKPRAPSRPLPWACHRGAAWRCWQRPAPGRCWPGATTSSRRTYRPYCPRWPATACATRPTRPGMAAVRWCSGCCAKFRLSEGHAMLVKVRPLWQSWIARRIPPSPSLQLNQRRIFIIPTRQGLAFGGALLLMLLAAINYQNSLAYGLTFLLLSLFIVAILHTYRNLGGLRLSALGAQPVFVGEQAAFRVRLEGEGRNRQAIGLGWEAERMQFADVTADHAEELLLSVPAERRGWLRPGRLRVESRFPLGLLVAWSWVDLDQSVLVYPHPQPGDLPLESGAAENDEEGVRPSGRGVDDYQGLRPYQPGDSRRRLHWKAYSRGQGLLVKDFSALAGRNIWLEFDSLGGDTEGRLSRLCFWVLQLTRRQQPFGLRLPDAQLAVGLDDAHRDACLRALALHGTKR